MAYCHLDKAKCLIRKRRHNKDHQADHEIPLTMLKVLTRTKTVNNITK